MHAEPYQLEPVSESLASVGAPLSEAGLELSRRFEEIFPRALKSEDVSDSQIDQALDALEQFAGGPLTEEGRFADDSVEFAEYRKLNRGSAGDRYYRFFNVILKSGKGPDAFIDSFQALPDNPSLINRIEHRAAQRELARLYDPKFRGEFLGEENSGRFLMTAPNLDQKPLISSLLDNPKHTLTVVHLPGEKPEVIKKLKFLTPDQQARISFQEGLAHTRWTQDFQAIAVRDSNGKTVYLDPFYPGELDGFARQQAKWAGGQSKPFPLKIEGGNLVKVQTAKGSFTAISTKVLEDNTIYSEDQVKKIASQYLGPIVWVPPQNDGTGHVDMQMLVRRDPAGDTVFVGKVAPESTAFVKGGGTVALDIARETYRAPKDFLSYYSYATQSRGSSAPLAAAEAGRHALDLMARRLSRISANSAKALKEHEQANTGYNTTADLLTQAGAKVVRVPVPGPSIEMSNSAPTVHAPLNAVVTGSEVHIPFDRYPTSLVLLPQVKRILDKEFDEVRIVPCSLNGLQGGPHCTVAQPGR